MTSVAMISNAKCGLYYIRGVSETPITHV